MTHMRRADWRAQGAGGPFQRKSTRKTQESGIESVMRRQVLLGVLGACVLGCGGPDRNDEDDTMVLTTLSAGIATDPSASGDDDGGDDGTEVLDVGSSNTGGQNGGDDSACPCGDNANLIYVLSDSAELYTYNPETNAFAALGSFTCPSPALDTTFSMGVARSGTAWVMYSPSGEIFNVDVNAANVCTDPGYTPGGSGFTLFGMAFVSESANSPCDTLFAHSWSGSAGGFGEGPNTGRLGRLDDLVPAFVNDVDFDGGELTGTGDGRLFAFAGSNPAKLIEYNKGTGDVVEITPLTGLELTQAFAFGFWGGDFYFFTEGDGLGATTSKVTKLDHDGDGSLTTVNANAPVRIVGAGVSTCAPFTPQG